MSNSNSCKVAFTYLLTLFPTPTANSVMPSARAARAAAAVLAVSFDTPSVMTTPMRGTPGRAYLAENISLCIWLMASYVNVLPRRW